MEEPERKAAASVGEYLESAREAGGIFRWIWREVTTPQSRRKLYRMFGGLLVVIILQTVQPGAVALIFNGLTSRNGTLICWGLGIFLGCLLVQKLADRYQESAREWVLGLHWGRLDDRITELFFEKSVESSQSRMVRALGGRCSGSLARQAMTMAETSEGMSLPSSKSARRSCMYWGRLCLTW